MSGAACLFVILGLELAAMDFGDASEQRNDPLRMIAAVTAGVAFLGFGPGIHIEREGPQHLHRDVVVARGGNRPRMCCWANALVG